MNVTLTPTQEAFLRQAIQTGRIERAEDAIAEALLLWEEREMQFAELQADIEAARASFARGQGRLITREAMETLATEAKQRLRRRLAEEKSADV